MRRSRVLSQLGTETLRKPIKLGPRSTYDVGSRTDYRWVLRIQAQIVYDSPMEAVDRFLAGNDQFVIDQRCERFLMTLNPRGYLRRIKPPPPPSAD